MAEHLLYEKRDGVVYITFNRPEVMNAMTPEMVVRLTRAWRDFKEDDNMRVAILTGAGDKAFSAGADLKRHITLMNRSRPPEDEWDHEFIRDRVNIGKTAMLRGFELYKPVIAAVNGVCLAGGTEMLQGCDIRIAAEHATFALMEVKRALIPGGGSLARLVRQVPFCKAMEILMVGDPMTAQEAYRIGFVNYVVPKEELMPTAEKLARKIAENGPLAVRKIKETVLRTMSLPLEEAFKVELDEMMKVFASEDAKEGARAWAEKRKPRWVGR